MKPSVRAMAATDQSKITPQPESSISPLLFSSVTRDMTESSASHSDAGMMVVGTLPNDLTSGGARGVPLVWETPSSGEVTVYARKKPLGVQFKAEFPLRVKREPEGHGKEIGIEVGWILKTVNGIDVASKDNMEEVNEILYREVGEKTMPVEELRRHSLDPVPRGVPLIWDTPSGERTVYARKKPLGVQFKAEFPLKVKREPEGHGKNIGIEVGWILKSVNGVDVTTMRDIKKINELLYSEVGEKTIPVDQWNK